MMQGNRQKFQYNIRLNDKGTHSCFIIIKTLVRTILQLTFLHINSCASYKNIWQFLKEPSEAQNPPSQLFLNKLKIRRYFSLTTTHGPNP